METNKEKKIRHLREEEKIAEKKWLGLTGNLIESGPDKGYEEVDFGKRAAAERELREIRKELNGEC